VELGRAGGFEAGGELEEGEEEGDEDGSESEAGGGRWAGGQRVLG